MIQFEKGNPKHQSFNRFNPAILKNIEYAYRNELMEDRIRIMEIIKDVKAIHYN